MISRLKSKGEEEDNKFEQKKVEKKKDKPDAGAYDFLDLSEEEDKKPTKKPVKENKHEEVNFLD